jgi:branched-chain amino acid transport system substrate-binding protein
VKKTRNEPNRLIFQAADCLLVIADAIKRAGGTDPEPLMKALRETDLTGTRGRITFSADKGYTFQQWVDIPHLAFQITQVKQKLDDTTIVQQPGQPLDTSKIVQP